MLCKMGTTGHIHVWMFQMVILICSSLVFKVACSKINVCCHVLRVDIRARHACNFFFADVAGAVLCCDGAAEHLLVVNPNWKQLWVMHFWDCQGAWTPVPCFCRCIYIHIDCGWCCALHVWVLKMLFASFTHVPAVYHGLYCLWNVWSLKFGSTPGHNPFSDLGPDNAEPQPRWPMLQLHLDLKHTSKWQLHAQQPTQSRHWEQIVTFPVEITICQVEQTRKYGTWLVSLWLCECHTGMTVQPWSYRKLFLQGVGIWTTSAGSKHDRDACPLSIHRVHLQMFPSCQLCWWTVQGQRWSAGPDLSSNPPEQASQAVTPGVPRLFRTQWWDVRRCVAHPNPMPWSSTSL